MSTTEALRTQLNALKTQLYALEAKNRTLREERPELAERIEVEEEENVRLAQKISELSAGGERASGTPGPELQERLAQLEGETATLKLQCVEKDEELEGTKRRCIEQQAELESEKEARREMMA